MKAFLQQHAAHWSTLEGGEYTMAKVMHCAKAGGLSAFQDALITIGVVLAVRNVSFVSFVCCSFEYVQVLH